MPLHFTEVTVLSGRLKTDDDWFSFHPGWDSTPEGEVAQAEYVADFYTVLFSHPSVEAITWWDLSDMEAWQGAPAGLLREDMTAKPAYEELKRLIHQEWWTDTDVSTNQQGEAAWRGFYGRYRLTATVGPQRVETEVHLERGAQNLFTIQLQEPASAGTPEKDGPELPEEPTDTGGADGHPPLLPAWGWAIAGGVVIVIVAIWLWSYIGRRRH